MSDVKLDPAELALFAEVGSRGDYFREATRDRAAQQVNETGRFSEITTQGGQMVDVVMGSDPTTVGETVQDVVPPSDFMSVVGKDPGEVVDAPKHGSAKDSAGT